MSASMYWRPVPVNPDGEQADDDVMRALGRRLWNDSSADEPTRGRELEIGTDMLPYLDGLADGSVEGAAELAEAIRKHKSIHVWIER